MTPTAAFSAWTLASLIRCSLGLVLAAGIVHLALRVLRVQSPRWHRLAWLTVLLQGWLWMGWSVHVPFELPRWLDAAAPVTLPRAALSHVPSPARPQPAITPVLVQQVPIPTGAIQQQSEPAAVSHPAPLDAIPAVPSAQPIVRDLSRGAGDRLRITDVMLQLWRWGALACLVWGLWRYVRFVRALPVGQSPEAGWREEWQNLLLDSRVRSDVRLRVTEELGPILVRLATGYRLYVPRNLWERLTSTQRIAILRHELAHLERGDVWWSLFVRLLALPQWFNPLAWYAVRRFDEAAEWACDDAVAAADPEARTSYADALLSLGSPRPRPYALHPAAAGQPLAWRIRRLLVPTFAFDSRLKRAALLVGLLLLVAFGLLRFRSQPKPPPQTFPTAGPSTQDSSSNNSVVSADLTYDGKTFAEWKRDYLTELSPARRTEAVKAFAAFAANGYGQEAVNALFDVVKGYDFTTIDGTPVGQLKQTTINALGELDPALTIERLQLLLASDKSSDRVLGIWMLLGGGQFAAPGGRFDPNIELLTEVFQHSPHPDVRANILSTFQYAGLPIQSAGISYDNPQWLPTLLTALQDPSPNVVLVALDRLVPAPQQVGGFGGGGASGKTDPDPAALVFRPEFLPLLEHPDPKVRSRVVGALGTLGPKAAPAVKALIARFQAKENQSQILSALRSIGTGAGFWPFVSEIAAMPVDGDLLHLVRLLINDANPATLPPSLTIEKVGALSDIDLHAALQQAVAERLEDLNSEPPAAEEPSGPSENPGGF